jgi:hypothetical protein
LKQVIVLNSALGLVDLIERDRSKATVVAEGFRALSERFILVEAIPFQFENFFKSPDATKKEIR